MRNKRNKIGMKWLSVCIALILTISMALPVQAAVEAEKTYSITVTGTATDVNATVTAYQIMGANFDITAQQPKEPFYVWTDAVSEWLKANDTYKSYVGDNKEVTEAFLKAEAGARSKLMNAMKKAIQENALQLSASATGTINSENYTTVLSGLQMGGYLLVTTPDPNGKYKEYEYAAMTANLLPVYDEGTKEWSVKDAAVALKGAPGSIDKEADDNTVAIGQTVKYTLHAPVPSFPEDATKKIFRIGDTMPVGITFAPEIADNQLQVFAVSSDGTERPIHANAGVFTYYYDKKDCGLGGIKDQTDPTEGRNATFILDFNYDQLMTSYGNTEGKTLKEIKVTYQGTINEHAFDNDDALKNEAFVGKNDPYNDNNYETTTDKEEVFVYEMEITKVEKGGKKTLAGAEFQLFAKKDEVTNPNKAIKFVEIGSDEGNYRLAKADESGTTTLAVGKSGDRVGKLNLKGLATGTYYLKETKAPAGFELLKDPIEITITDENTDGIVDDGGDVQGDTVLKNIYYKTVENSKPPIMPVTGGMGTILFTILGVVLVAGGLTLIVNYRRRHQG